MSSQIIVDYPQDNSKGISTIGNYSNSYSILINGTITESMFIEGSYLSGSVTFNNNNTILYAGYGTGTHTLEFPECNIYNESFPKGDTLNLTCNEEGSATFKYQFADIVVI